MKSVVVEELQSQKQIKMTDENKKPIEEDTSEPEEKGESEGEETE